MVRSTSLQSILSCQLQHASRSCASFANKPTGLCPSLSRFWHRAPGRHRTKTAEASSINAAVVRPNAQMRCPRSGQINATRTRPDALEKRQIPDHRKVIRRPTQTLSRRGSVNTMRARRYSRTSQTQDRWPPRGRRHARTTTPRFPCQASHRWQRAENAHAHAG